MTLSGSFIALQTQLQNLEHELSALDWAIVQAKPSSQLGKGLANELNDTVLQIRGIVHEAIDLADLAINQTETHKDITKMYRALIGCQEHANQALNIFYARLECPPTWKSLTWLASQSKDDWAPWVAGVNVSLRACANLLLADESMNLHQALLSCWQDLGDHIRCVQEA